MKRRGRLSVEWLKRDCVSFLPHLAAVAISRAIQRVKNLLKSDVYSLAARVRRELVCPLQTLNTDQVMTKQGWGHSPV